MPLAISAWRQDVEYEACALVVSHLSFREQHDDRAALVTADGMVLGVQPASCASDTTGTSPFLSKPPPRCEGRHFPRFAFYVERRDNMLDTIYISGMSFEELLALFLCDVADDDDFYDVLAYNLAKSHRQQVEGMLQSLSSKRLRAAICGLGLAAPYDNGSGAVVSRYITHSNALVVAAAIDALQRIGSVEWAEVKPALQHPSAYVRGAALRFARSKLGAESVPVLIEGLRDSDAIVRQNALDELDGVATSQEIPHIALCLNDPSAEVRQAAQTLLESIADSDS